MARSSWPLPDTDLTYPAIANSPPTDADSAWNTLASSSWAYTPDWADAAGVYSPPVYRVDALGDLHFEGDSAKPTTFAGLAATVGTLPAGLRPIGATIDYFATQIALSGGFETEAAWIIWGATSFFPGLTQLRVATALGAQTVLAVNWSSIQFQKEE